MSVKKNLKVVMIKMFVPFNGAWKSFLSFPVKLTLNEAISLNSRELLQIPLDSTTQFMDWDQRYDLN